MTSPAIQLTSRAQFEAFIEQLIALLDEVDGDENLELYLTGSHPAHEGLEFDCSDLEHSTGWCNPRCGAPDIAEG